MKVTLDSRQVKKGDYFVAVKGDNFDGHDYIDQALKNGAVGVLEETELYEIASKTLAKINPVVIGIAGSVGKSTFRSFLTQILNYKVKALEGSLNTKLGLATNVVNGMKSDDNVFVAEMGIDRLGEMGQTALFIKPNFSVITKLEKEHLQFLLSLKNVVRENAFSILLSKEKFGYINESDANLVKKPLKSCKVVYFSKDFDNKVFTKIDTDLFSDHDLDYLDCIYKIVTSRFGFTDEDFINAVKKLKRPKGRLNIITGKNNSIIIDDSYNAVCDESVIKGIKYAISKSKNKDLHIVLSPLRETGDSSKEQHKNVASFLNKNYKKFLSVTLVGDSGEYYLPYLKFKTNVIDTAEQFSAIPKKTDIFYIKGSQFYRTEKCVIELMQNPQQAKDLLVRQDERWV